jgi:hypothetical protein
MVENGHAHASKTKETLLEIFLKILDETYSVGAGYVTLVMIF